jgi:hypothetical protein
MKVMPIGLGCFHFGIGKAFGNKFDWKLYYSELRKSLESITNISDLSIEEERDPNLFI